MLFFEVQRYEIYCDVGICEGDFLVLGERFKKIRQDKNLPDSYYYSGVEKIRLLP